jgi:type III pantothenate kinase
MNLVIDRGNSRIKAGLYNEKTLVNKFSFSTEAQLVSFLQDKDLNHILISSVAQPANELLAILNASGKKIELTHRSPVPIKNLYATPETLGVDRLAAACGALDIFPNRNCLVIDIGTCINYEFVDAQASYHGGAISPGIKIRYEGMHKFTGQLPLIANDSKAAPLIGDTTETCMRSGVINGMIAEINGIIGKYQEIYPGLGVILCGGDYPLFENQLKPHIFVAPDLVLIGLNRILLHNVSL